MISRLALTHYEELEYEKALELDQQALALAPSCPLALWGYAGSLEMLSREHALKIYQRSHDRVDGLSSRSRFLQESFHFVRDGFSPDSDSNLRER